MMIFQKILQFVHKHFVPTDIQTDGPIDQWMDWQKDQPTDGWTNGQVNKAAYRVACTGLKTQLSKELVILMVFFVILGLWGRPLRVTPRQCIILEKWQCKKKQKNLTGDRYQVTVCLFNISYDNSEVLQLPPLKLTLFHHNFLMIQARKFWLVPFSCKLFAVPTSLSFDYTMTILGENASFKSKYSKTIKIKNLKYTMKTSF